MLLAAAQQVASDCVTLPGWDEVLWDPTASAGSYATLSALLAGFSLSGLLWISSSAQPDRIGRTSAVVSIWASLVPLVLATLMFAEIEGEAKCDQAVIEVTVALLLFTVGAVSLFVSLGQLLTRVFDSTADRLAQLVSWTALVLGSVGIYAGNSTMANLLESESWDTTPAARIQLVFVAGSIVLASAWRRSFTGVTPLVYVILVSAIGFGVFYFTAFTRPISWMPNALSWARVLMWCAFAVTAASVIRSPAPPAATEAAGDVET